MSESFSFSVDRARSANFAAFCCLTILLALLATAAHAADGDGPTTLADLSFYNKLIGTLLGALVVATILESALAVLFNWRIYTIVFNGRATKTIFMVIGAFLIVDAFDYDIVARILAQVDARAVTVASSGGSILLSVLFLAGGSAGVHNILRKFGWRGPAQEAVAEKLDETEAWISVNVVRRQAKGPVEVRIEEIKPEPARTYPPLASVLDDTPVWRRVWLTIWARPMRYPPYGGRTVRTTKYYRITVEGEGISEADGKVFEGRFASRAVVDFIKTV